MQALKIIISYSASNQARYQFLWKHAHQSYSGHHGVPSNNHPHISAFCKRTSSSPNGTNRDSTFTQGAAVPFSQMHLTPPSRQALSLKILTNHKTLFPLCFLYFFYVVIGRRPEPHSAPTSSTPSENHQGHDAPSLPKSRNPCTSRFRASKI